MIDHRLVDRFSILRRLEKDVVGLGAIHHALVNEKVGEAFVIHSLRFAFNIERSQSGDPAPFAVRREENAGSRIAPDLLDFARNNDTFIVN